MSYNTRRSQGFGPSQQNSNSVGQRRPVVTNNFVPGGQLPGNQQQQQKAPLRQPHQQPQQQSGINFRNQQNQNSANQQQQQQPPQQQLSQTYYKSQIKQEQKPVQQQQQPKPAPVVPGANPPPPEVNKQADVMDTTGDSDVSPNKKLWMKKTGKISKAERNRRRNMRLSKILQPKNAVMILNELVKGCQFVVEQAPSRADGGAQFKGTVVFEDNKFCGVGRTKNAAKSAAAEAALKHLIKNKQLKLKKEDEEEDGDVKMEISEDGTQVLPWSHIASFAMYKLFSSWGEEGLANRGLELLGNAVAKPNQAAAPVPGQRVEPKPSRKMPEEPEKMNPCMLMNQMLPMAQWQELEKTGTPPKVNFTFSVTVEGKTFKGTGPSKKAAKKAAAFAACNNVLNVIYPADVWVPPTM